MLALAFVSELKTDKCGKGVQSIRWVKAHCVLTLRISIRFPWEMLGSLRALAHANCISQVHAWWLWGLKLTALTIFQSLAKKFQFNYFVWQLKERGHAGLKLRDLQVKLDKLLLSCEQARANAVEERERAGLKLHKLRAKLDGLLLSHGIILSITYPFNCG